MLLLTTVFSTNHKKSAAIFYNNTIKNTLYFCLNFEKRTTRVKSHPRTFNNHKMAHVLCHYDVGVINEE